MLRRVLIGCRVAVIVAAVGYGLAHAFSGNWPSVSWCMIVVILATELLIRDMWLPNPAGDRCTVCGRRRLGGGVFVAGMGSICFECEEREFGVDLDELNGGDDVRS